MQATISPVLEIIRSALARAEQGGAALLPPLHPKQGEFVATDAHFAAMIGGIGSGKSIAGCVRGLMAAYGTVGSHKIQTPNLGVITAPTYPMLRDATLRTFKEYAGDRLVSYNKSEGLATLANGSEIIFRSTEHPDRLRGPSISWWFGDEAAMYSPRPSVWKIMIGRLRQYGKRGYAWLATTPRGHNWLYKVFVRDGSGKVFPVRSDENPYLDQAVLDAWNASYTGDFARQELGGEFVAFEGLVYPEFSLERHKPDTEMPTRFSYTVAGVDWGYANPGVILVGGVDSDGRITVVAEYYARSMRVEEWASLAVQLRDTWSIQTFWCDPSDPDAIRVFNEAGVVAIGANNTVNTGLQMVKNRLVAQGDGKPRLLLGPDCVNTASEFEQYQWMKDRHGLRDQPVKANDHAMDALRYLVMGIDEPSSITVRKWSDEIAEFLG